MPRFLISFSEQLSITVHRRKKGTKIHLCCTKSYFTLPGGSKCCYRQMVKIIVCWKMISCCDSSKLLQNTV